MQVIFRVVHSPPQPLDDLRNAVFLGGAADVTSACREGFGKLRYGELAALVGNSDVGHAMAVEHSCAHLLGVTTPQRDRHAKRHNLAAGPIDKCDEIGKLGL